MWTLIPFTFWMLLAASCATPKNTAYFKDLPDSLKDGNGNIALAEFAEPKIRPSDLLYISIQTLDPRATNNITGNASGQTPGAGAAAMPGYHVDKNGNIELPLVGTVKISGFSTTEAKEVIRKKAAVYYKDPVVNVRYANFNVTVLGEVSKPAQYTVPSERVTLLDAIGMAGDLTIYGKRENVLLLREENGVKIPVRFNLNSADLMSSPYFYLKQNDVIYVEPNQQRVAGSDVVRSRNTGYAITILSTLISVAVILIVNR